VVFVYVCSCDAIPQINVVVAVVIAIRKCPIDVSTAEVVELEIDATIVIAVIVGDLTLFEPWLRLPKLSVKYGGRALVTYGSFGEPANHP
jgi:hypothetical protein